MRKSEIVLTVVCVFLALYCVDLKIENTICFKEREDVFDLKRNYEEGISSLNNLVYEIQKSELLTIPIQKNIEKEYQELQQLNLAQKVEKYMQNKESLGGN